MYYVFPESTVYCVFRDGFDVQFRSHDFTLYRVFENS